MNKEEMRTFPTIQGKFDNQIYYLGTMTFRQIADLVFIHDVDHDNEPEFDGFGVLPIEIDGGAPEWHQVCFQNNDCSQMGFLQLRGDELLTATDAQWQVNQIRKILKEKPDAENNTLPIIFISVCK